MSGSQPPPATPPAGAAPADPSMEDILASIRRILSEDEPAPAAPAPPPAPVAEAADSDVLVLDETMQVADEPPEAEPSPLAVAPLELPPPEPEPEVEPEPEPLAAPEPAPAPVFDLALPTAATLASELMAPETSAAAVSSVSGLMRTLASERSTHVWAGGPTIEDLVREELRPLLKQWLDSYLPELVERLVAAEIERVVRRAVP